MYEQDIILGPLTFKQFFILSIGFIFSYAIYKYSENYLFIGIVAVLSFYFAFYGYKNRKIPIEEIEQYFKLKKSELAPDEYDKIIKRRIASLESQIDFRRQKGLVEDNNLLKILNIIKNL